MGTVNVSEKLANLGYLAFKKEAAKGTPETPDTFVPLYSEDITHSIHLDEDSPIVGVREARFKVFRGQEDIQGTIRVLAEPKTVAHFFNMLLYKATAAGTGTPTTGYTHTFTIGGEPKSYTLEFLKGNIPVRLYSVEAKSITPVFEDNKMVLEVAISARGQFSVVKLVSATGTPTGTVVLDVTERRNPADGLVVGNTLRLYDVSAGTDEDVLITAINADGKTITTGGITGTYIAGDIAYLKPLTPSLSTMQKPFNWAETQFKFGADDAAALAAAQTRIEKDSKWAIRFDMEDEAGAMRSGGYQPAKFVRTTADVDISLKKFFNDGQELDRFLQVGARALVVEHTSPTNAGTDGTKALIRLTVNEYYIKEYNIPLKSKEIIYSEMVLVPVYHETDSQMFDLKVITSEETV